MYINTRTINIVQWKNDIFQHFSNLSIELLLDEQMFINWFTIVRLFTTNNEAFLQDKIFIKKITNCDCFDHSCNSSITILCTINTVWWKNYQYIQLLHRIIIIYNFKGYKISTQSKFIWIELLSDGWVTAFTNWFITGRLIAIKNRTK